MLSKLNLRQRTWLDKATSEQLRAFLAKGEPEVGEMIDMHTRISFFCAGIRGLRVGTTEFKSAEEAYAYAQAEWHKLRADTSLPVLDEAALGIDSRNATINDLLEQATIRADQIIHLGSMVTDSDAIPDCLQDFLDDLDERIEASLCEDMPWLHELLEDTEEDTEPMAQLFNEQLYRYACYGYLVKYATPVMKAYKSGSEWRSGIYSWGYYTTQWFYGESLEETTRKAIAWAEQCRADEKAKAEAKETAGQQ